MTVAWLMSVGRCIRIIGYIIIFGIFSRDGSGLSYHSVYPLDDKGIKDQIGCKGDQAEGEADRP